jgi:hypothetical protein
VVIGASSGGGALALRYGVAGALMGMLVGLGLGTVLAFVIKYFWRAIAAAVLLAGLRLLLGWWLGR